MVEERIALVVLVIAFAFGIVVVIVAVFEHFFCKRVSLNQP